MCLAWARQLDTTFHQLTAHLWQVTDQYNEHWRTDWIASDFWYLLNFIFLCVVCWLFRPSQQAARYSDLDGVPTASCSAAAVAPQHEPSAAACCSQQDGSPVLQAGRSKTDGVR